MIPRTRIKYTCGNADYMIHNKERQEMTVFVLRRIVYLLRNMAIHTNFRRDLHIYFVADA